MPDTTPRLLEGIRVIEMASYISGPLAGSIIAELGAEVVKLEHPPTGDPFRGWGSAESPRASFIAYNASKASVCVDWTSERAWFDELLRSSDVLLSNFRPATQEKLGLTYDHLKKINNQLIVCNITGFGRTGDYADRPCYDAVAQAMSGLMSQLTDTDQPQCVGPPLSDSVAGLYSAIAILAALVERQHTGEGRAVDVSMVGASLSLIRNAVGSELLESAPSGKQTRAMSSQSYAFVGQDGKGFVVHLSTPQKFWLGLLDTVGRPELANDERFKDKKSRIRNYTELQYELQSEFSKATRHEWLSRLNEHDVPCGPILSPAEAASNSLMIKVLPDPAEQFELAKRSWLEGLASDSKGAAPSVGGDNERFGLAPFQTI